MYTKASLESLLLRRNVHKSFVYFVNQLAADNGVERNVKTI